MLPAATWVRPPSRAGLHKARRAVQVVTSLLFIFAPFLDILRFDVKNGALILFGASLDLGELGIAYGILLLTFVVVFAGALLYGRIYCGWMCPQTTLSEIVATFERWVCPKRGARTLRCKVLSTLASVGMAYFVAWSLVSYFLDRSDWFWPSATTWISFAITGAVISADFLWLRHRFCVGVCPYGILQNIIQDRRTLGVELDPARQAECTNCLLCVRACFMGVDIRKEAFDPRCLNCGDCIAATKLAKTCPEEPLISFRYGTEGKASRWPGWLRKAGVLDYRRVVVMGLTFAACGLVTWQATSRQEIDLHFTALFDRTVTDPSGLVHNTYRLAANSHLKKPVQLTLQPSGVQGLAVEGSPVIELAARERIQREVVLSAPAAQAGNGVHPIVVKGVREGATPVDLQTRFFVPDRR